MTVDLHQAMAPGGGRGGPRRSAQGPPAMRAVLPRTMASRMTGRIQGNDRRCRRVDHPARGLRKSRDLGKSLATRRDTAPSALETCPCASDGAARRRFHGFSWRRQALHRSCGPAVLKLATKAAIYRALVLSPTPDWSVRRRIACTGSSPTMEISPRKLISPTFIVTGLAG